MAAAVAVDGDPGLELAVQQSGDFPGVSTGSYVKMANDRGVFWGDIASSLTSAGIGFALGFLFGVPVAFLMAWYRPVRNIIEPWIQFVRNIPPLAYVPLVVIAVGVGRAPQIIVICIATFLTISITVFQGVINVDETLIKAARVLGANDAVLFTRVIFPATTPFIITSIRLGISVALTTQLNPLVPMPVWVCGFGPSAPPLKRSR